MHVAVRYDRPIARDLLELLGQLAKRKIHRALHMAGSVFTRAANVNHQWTVALAAGRALLVEYTRVDEITTCRYLLQKSRIFEDSSEGRVGTKSIEVRVLSGP